MWTKSLPSHTNTHTHISVTFWGQTLSKKKSGNQYVQLVSIVLIWAEEVIGVSNGFMCASIAEHKSNWKMKF